MADHKKIGIMGGTFDPIHIGHLILGEKTYEQLGLDQKLSVTGRRSYSGAAGRLSKGQCFDGRRF